MQLESISYEDGEYRGHLRLELALDRVAPREHLLNAVLAEQTERTYALPGHLDDVALKHLRERTGTSGRITDDAQRFQVILLPPTPLAERPPMYGGPDPFLPDGKLRELTSAHAAMLPELAAAIGQVTPAKYQPHATDLARLLAQEIPSQADVLRAYQRTSIPETQAEHHAYLDYWSKTPAERNRKPGTVTLDFPQHPREALHTAPTNPARDHAGRPGHPTRKRALTGPGRVTAPERHPPRLRLKPWRPSTLNRHATRPARSLTHASNPSPPWSKAGNG